MDDRELLGLAAKAAGDLVDGPIGPVWNPLNDDGDALRLATKLRLDIAIGEVVQVSWIDEDNSFQWVEEPAGVVRRAIVRAAAEIGRSMP